MGVPFPPMEVPRSIREATAGRRRARGKNSAPPGVDYRLARLALLRDFRAGLRSRVDICDAHPELVRAARHIGELLSHPCPICDSEDLRAVFYTYEGRNVKKGRARRPEDIRALRNGPTQIDCYVIEVCAGCNWNHLIRQFVTGRAAG